jgi:hypothetical protein
MNPSTDECDDGSHAPTDTNAALNFSGRPMLITWCVAHNSLVERSNPSIRSNGPPELAATTTRRWRSTNFRGRRVAPPIRPDPTCTPG